MWILGDADCDTPGFGGAGNTHSPLRSLRVQQSAQSHPPNNNCNWTKPKLQLVSNMNIDDSCNAYYNGQFNFFKSSATCRNIGEIAVVLDGHEMNTHGSNGNIGNPLGEEIADIYFALRLNDRCERTGVECGTSRGPAVAFFRCAHAVSILDVFVLACSCIGRGFFKNGVCNSRNNSCNVGGCTGARDIDFLQKQRPAPNDLPWALANCRVPRVCHKSQVAPQKINDK